MKKLRPLRGIALVLACAGMLTPLVTASDRPNFTPGSRSQVAGQLPDVELADAGTLRGMVFDRQGIPQIHARVTIRQAQVLIARTTTDASGRFEISGLRGGVYLVIASGRAAGFRLWPVNSAPPIALDKILLVAGGKIQRGQTELTEIFWSKAITLTAVTTAAIAIPIIVYNNRASSS